MRHLITCESALEGHPDKLCDQLADMILDACLTQDPRSRVACEMLVTDKRLIIAGEITTKAKIHINRIIREKIIAIGYDDSKKSFNGKTCKITNLIHQQSPDIAKGVDIGGAGDQGIMYGYATAETDEFLPLTHVLANRLAKKMVELRHKGAISMLYPDGKTQVTIEYKDKKAQRAEAIVIAAQHEKGIDQKGLRDMLISKAIRPVLGKRMDTHTKIFVNPTGIFNRWGPKADTWLTGRKNIMDTYGGRAKHGGWSYSGKDCTKVDRSASYMARYLAKNIVASDIARECEIQLAYVIGIKDPVGIDIDCFWTEKVPLPRILDCIKTHFDLTPKGMIKKLDLRKPIFEQTSLYGHFGNPKLPWEALKDTKIFKALLKT